MPSFSMPNSSHSTLCIEAYLAARHKGASCLQATRNLDLAQFSIRTLRRMESRVSLRTHQLKAVEAKPSIQYERGYDYLRASAGNHLPLATLTRRYLEAHGWGWLFGNPRGLGSRYSAGAQPPHNLSAPQRSIGGIDSS